MGKKLERFNTAPVLQLDTELSSGSARVQQMECIKKAIFFQERL